MPTNAPTVDEVRELLAMLERPEDALDIGAYYARVFAFLCRHFLDSQDDAPYTQLGKGLFEALDATKAVRNAEELHNLNQIDAFLQVWSQQKEEIRQLKEKLVANPMTAGEFAGLVVDKISRRRENLQRTFLIIQRPELANRCWLNRKGVDESLEDLRAVAAEHNIEIVEPKK